MIYNDLISGQKKMAVIGLGYVGLPIALEFAKKISVIGFDIKDERVALMKNKVDPSNELSSEDFEGCDIKFTSSLDDLREASFYVVAVPTPIDEHKNPDLSPVLSATTSVGKVLSEGDYVVYESTVYPGCTEEDCIPLLSEVSGLKYMDQFKVGFSPERINPGDREHTLTKITKVTSGCDAESAEEIARTYELVIEAGVHRASSIKVAEAAKIIENTQRDINIAFMNELSMIFNKMDINTFEVLEAAGTKWNFLNFFPGLVGGHCIGVDPYYLTHCAQEVGYHPEVVLAGRRINDGMGAHVADRIARLMMKNGFPVVGSRILMMGLAFKENCPDLRNSKVIDVINEFKDYNAVVDVFDPWVDPEEAHNEFGLELMIGEPGEGLYDAIVMAVGHREFTEIGAKRIRSFGKNGAVFFDVKAVFDKAESDGRL